MEMYYLLVYGNNSHTIFLVQMFQNNKNFVNKLAKMSKKKEIIRQNNFFQRKFLHCRTNLTTLTPTNATFTTTVSSPNNSLLLAVCSQPGVNNVTVGLVNTSSPIYDRSQMSCTQSKCYLPILNFARW